MNVKYSTFTVLFLCIATAKASIPIEDDYYWRDFTDEVPYDALSGGIESSGKRTYVGQTVDSKKPNIIPGEFRSTTKKLYYQMSGAFETSDNVKIVCARHPEKYHWVKTTIDEMKNLNRDYLVVGGWEGLPLYIGRVEHEGEKVIGKINLDYTEKQYRALWIAHNDKEHHVFDNFEVLMYNPDSPKDIDISGTRIININIHNYN